MLITTCNYLIVSIMNHVLEKDLGVADFGSELLNQLLLHRCVGLMLHTVEQFVRRRRLSGLFELSKVRVHLAVERAVMLLIFRYLIFEGVPRLPAHPRRSHTFSLNRPDFLGLTHIDPAIAIGIIQQSRIQVSTGYSQSCAHLFIRDTRHASGRCFSRFSRSLGGSVEWLTKRTSLRRGNERILSTGPLAPSPPR